MKVVLILIYSTYYAGGLQTLDFDSMDKCVKFLSNLEAKQKKEPDYFRLVKGTCIPKE